jgi:Patched family
LDDTFIITGAYARTDQRKEPAERIRETMQDVGLSISITTITTLLVFLTGCFSTIPAIFWLNLYAFSAIIIDFLFQISFFIGEMNTYCMPSPCYMTSLSHHVATASTALLVLDEKRIQDNRMDCCTCIQVSADIEAIEKSGVHHLARTKSVPERIMSWYARHLLRPWVKVSVLVVFFAYAGFCAYSTTLLTQHFDFADMLPAESYAKDFLSSIETYTSRVLGVKIYFRGDMDQLDPSTQKEMNDYIDELSGLPQFADEPLLCWFRDLDHFRSTKLAQSMGMSDNMTIQEQVDIAFSVPAIRETYGKHVVFDDNGRITASSCYTYISGVNLKVADEQIQVLQDQRAITAGQPMNQGQDDWPFFTFNSDYFIWVRVNMCMALIHCASRANPMTCVVVASGVLCCCRE